MHNNSAITKIWITILLTVVSGAAGFAATAQNTPPVVTNVVAGQLDDGSGKVGISYDVTDDERDRLSVMIEVSSDGGTTYLVPVSVENLSGDVGNGITPGKGKRIIWDAPKDQPNVNSASYRVRITAVEQPEGMVLIPAGRFIMGDDNGQADEQPAREVYLDVFFIDQYEVTNGQFAQFLNAIGRNEDTDGNRLIDLEDTDARIRYVVGRYYAVSGLGAHPVTEVTWYGAKAYAAWHGKRLPTEAEWEKAARGLDGRTYPWGESTTDMWGKANYNNHIGSTGGIGRYTKGRSPYGIYDMAGNVWEWVADVYDPDFYSISLDQNPFNDVTEEIFDSHRSLRGGSWFNITEKLRCAARHHQAPIDSGHSIGFRCAMSIHQ